ncbi:LCP family protein [Streptomyces sp. RB6PN25]|uniref:LCP family protein n=1 Tax=Streptomyces humicola TaxID=2953240 RepID=A0ABT1Q229_9ACTN|nr:LCP family protein [Streptomyces humicola]MCQ4083934.1 LCP family protein [Streptomyces humicola]
MVSASVLVLSGFAWYAYHSLTNGLTTSNALGVLKNGPGHLDNAVNLLLIGLDSRKDQNGNDLPKQFVQDELHAGSSDIGYYNTNTLILMHIPANGGKVTAFSIPRDDYVQTYNGDGTRQGMHKIKEAYGYAYSAAHDKLSAQGVTGADLEHQSREYGREATLATVQNLLGVPIDHFAEVNLLGFYDIAQVLQPIQVCLKHPVNDNYSGADFPAGLNNLNAKQALAFVRQRHGLTNGDLDRTHRQQAFLSSVVHKLKTEGIFSDLGKMQDLFNVVKKDMVIDNQWNVLDFASQATNLTGGNVAFNTLPITGFATENGESVNTVDPAYLKQVVQATFGEGASQPSGGKKSSSGQKAAPATVDVYNGSGIAGAASNELKDLASAGYTAGQAANASQPQSTTTVAYGAGAQQAAQQIAGRLNTSPAAASSSVPAGHVQITLGTDFTAPAPGSNGSSSGSSSGASGSGSSGSQPSPSPTFAGNTVKMGGIPCVD